MQYLTEIDKPKKLYALLYGTEMPRKVEAFIAMYCQAYDCKPDDAAIIRHILDAHLIHRMEIVPVTFNEQVKKMYLVIKADILKAANDNAQQQYDQYLSEFKESAISIVGQVAKAANRKAPERYKLLVTLAYTALTVTILSAMLAMKYDYNEMHMVGSLLFVGVIAFFGGMYAKE
jgi:hypothetical protein